MFIYLAVYIFGTPQINLDVLETMTDKDMIDIGFESFGDRVMLKGLIEKRRITLYGSASTSRRQELIARLRLRQAGRTHEEPLNKKAKTVRSSYMQGNLHARKTVRQVIVSWHHDVRGVLKEVRAKSGGGPRKHEIDITGTFGDLQDCAVKVYFQNGISKFGKLDDFVFKICGIDSIVMSPTESIGQYLSYSKVTKLRFNLVSSPRVSVTSTITPEILSSDEDFVQVLSPV